MGEAEIIGTEQERFTRWIKEAIEIRKRRGTTMNRDDGQYQLSHIFDEFLNLESKKSPDGKSTGNTKTTAGVTSSVGCQ